MTMSPKCGLVWNQHKRDGRESGCGKGDTKNARMFGETALFSRVLPTSPGAPIPNLSVYRLFSCWLVVLSETELVGFYQFSSFRDRGYTASEIHQPLLIGSLKSQPLSFVPVMCD